jgi:prepilin-type N-terminal cleavage/methylation domain-containing protein
MTDDGKMTNVQYRMSNVKVKELRRNNVEKTRDRRREKRAFTIVELLTVMSIIVILISILVPALNKVRRYALDVKERAQLYAIGTGLETFSAEFDGYPDSSESDGTGEQYCGAMKLAEAMVGQDLKGFNPQSVFRRDGYDSSGTNNLYPPTTDPNYVENIKSRKMYLQLENANATRLSDIWKAEDINDDPYYFNANNFVLCDVYSKVTNRTTGRKIGMPILYYKADPTQTMFPDETDDWTTISSNARQGKYIYNVIDNLMFVNIPFPWDPTNLTALHPMANWITGGKDPRIFYKKIRNRKVSDPWPYRADTFILMSAGYDGEYGTGDDIFNFGE